MLCILLEALLLLQLVHFDVIFAFELVTLKNFSLENSFIDAFL